MYVFGELKKADLENLSADVSPGVIGRIYYNTTSLKAMLDDGTVVRAFLKNDAYAVFGNNGTAANNIRLHRGASSVLQFVLGNDGTAEGTLSTALAKLSFKAEAYATGSLPSAANAGRIAWDTSLLALKVDNGSSWIALQPLATKGDLYSFSTVPVALGVGTNGQYLAAASGQTTGLQWTTFPVTTKGDIFVYSTTVDRLPVGSSLQLLGVSSAAGTGLAWTSATTTPTASAYAGWDTNVNFSANSFLPGYATTATGAALTTLAVTDKWQQFFTGSTTQTVKLPVTSTLALGQQFLIVNRSLGTVTVQSSGTNTIQAMGQNTQLLCTVILTSGTSTASWDAVYASNTVSAGGTVTSVTFTGDGTLLSSTPSAAVTTSGTVTAALKTQVQNTFLSGPTSGADSNPTFRVLATADFAVPQVTRLTSTGTTTGYLFTISTTSTCAVGDTYTNNGHTYTVVSALSAVSGQVLFMSGASAPQASGNLTRSAGAGTATIAFTLNTPLASFTTPTSPRGPLYLYIKLVGAGGGGSSGENGGSITAGTAGTTTAFGPLLVATGGAGGQTNGVGGAGGSTTVTSPALSVVEIAGAHGSDLTATFNGTTLAGATFSGPNGPSTAFGSGGTGGNAENAYAASANSGAGGAGGSTGGGAGGNVNGGAGGAGGYLEAIIPNPGATIYYAIGVKGAANAAGTGGFNGSNGGDGFIVATSFFQ